MTQGELEKLSIRICEIQSDMEERIMEDLVRRIKINGFSTASADWEVERLRQLGKSEHDIKIWVREALQTTDEEIDRIFGDEVYEQYMGQQKAYKMSGQRQIPFEENRELQSVISAVEAQTRGTFKNLTGSMGFAVRNPATGEISYTPLGEYYQQVLDSAMLDIRSGAFTYNQVLTRVINEMTNSGIRWIDYSSGVHNRVDVAARRAVMTGFRQIQGKINEQVARALGTDTYEVTYHVGARPTHQDWQGRVWTMKQLQEVCGLGSVSGLHGANCYHDYNPFIKGVSVRTYSDKQLAQMMQEENTPKTYNGREYTTYEALQRQRHMETNMRKTRQEINLLKKGEADEETITLKQAKYQIQMNRYADFSDKMKLPRQLDRVYQDGLKGITAKVVESKEKSVIIKSGVVSGARNPEGKAAKAHAEKYYGLVRSMTTDVEKIAKTTGFSREQIQDIKNYIFIDKHDLGGKEPERFSPDYMMAESWRRLSAGKPEPHDLTLLRHEIMEKKLMDAGYSQEEAHILTTGKYNYGKEAKEFYDKIKKYKKE